MAEPKGHGWVTPLPSGAVARCGGPGMCSHCQLETRVLQLTSALAATAKAAASMSDEMMRMTGRAEKAENELDAFIVVVADLLLALDTQAWPMIDAAARDANAVLLRAAPSTRQAIAESAT